MSSRVPKSPVIHPEILVPLPASGPAIAAVVAPPAPARSAGAMLPGTGTTCGRHGAVAVPVAGRSVVTVDGPAGSHGAARRDGRVEVPVRGGVPDVAVRPR
jgi:hypothetical protein